MPVYEYECTACAERFDKLVRAADADNAVCPSCGHVEVRRLLSVIAGLGRSAPDAQPVCGRGACDACA